MRGSSGSGVRFDRGATASAGYEFNLGQVIRFGASVDWGRIRNDNLPESDPTQEGYQPFTGVGPSENFMGPWNTLFQFDYRIAVQSYLPGLKGEQEFEIVLFKLF